jgi:outer membrane murein-binding lipoprotein Lpp
LSAISQTGRILCEIPPELRADLVKGAIRMTGSVLRDTKSGRIIGFLQEAAPLGRLLGSGVGLAGGLAGAPAMIGGIAATVGLQTASLVQGEVTRRGVKRTEATVKLIDGKVDHLGESLAQVQNKLSAMHQDIGAIGKSMQLLESVGVANVALSAVGVGVSVIGFGVMNAKLGQVQSAIRSMADRIDSISDKIDRLRQDAIDADFSDLLSLTGLYEECWGFLENTRAEQQWHRIQQDALVMQNRFANRAQKLLQVTNANIDAADPMLDAMALASGLRVAALIACNESGLARSVANESSRQIEVLTGNIGLVDLTAHIDLLGARPGTVEYDLALTSAREQARPLIRKLREREASIATRALPLATLEECNIAPRAWLEAARNEQDAPVLLLPIAGPHNS